MTMPLTPLRLGTRGSPLALAQAHAVRDALLAAHGWDPEMISIHPITTDGDRVQDRALAEIGGKALWTKELDRALAHGAIDFSVHSMKDVETVRPAEITLAAMLPREDVHDRLIGAETLAALPIGAVVGTSAPRRKAQLLRARPDLHIILFRGNVATRLARLADGEAQATLLAAAGLNRLGQSQIGHDMPFETMLPAPSQAAVGIETLSESRLVRGWLEAINHLPTWLCVGAERAFLAGLAADCHSPVAALAELDGGAIRLRGEILAEDGSETVAGELMLDTPEDGATLAAHLLAQASPALRARFGA